MKRIVAKQFFVERLDQAILKKAFCGELAPQDSNDEPASTLQECMQQIRESPAR